MKGWSPTENGPRPGPKLVPALRNAIQIIEAINARQGRSVFLAELSAELGITKSHCHGLLKTLTHAGWLRFDDRAKSYRLAAGLLASCSSLLASPDLERIRERLSQLVRESGFSAVLTQPQPDGDFVVVESIAQKNPMMVSYAVGARLPKDSPAQMRASLAWRPAAEQEEWLATWAPHQYTKSTITRPDALRAELAATRKRGYSRSVGEHFEGMLAYGLPVFDRDGRVLYVVCLLGFVAQAKELERAVAAALQHATKDIHAAIMAAPPEGFPGGG